MTTASEPFIPHPAIFAAVGVAHHRLSRDVRNGAYPVVPESVTSLVQAEDQLDELADDVNAPRETYFDFLKRTTIEAVDGAPITADIVREARSAINQAETARLDRLLIGQLREGIQSRWTEELRKHADSMLEGLQPDLQDIVDQVNAAAATLAPVDISDVEAIASATAKQQAALANIASLRSRYRRLRNLQHQLLESVGATPAAVKVPGSNWQTVFRTEVTSYSNIPAFGVPPTDYANAHWWKRIAGRDDIWIPTLPELAEAIRRGTHQLTNEGRR